MNRQQELKKKYGRTIKAAFYTQPSNFIGEDGRLFVVRCPVCNSENNATFVASGQCAKCGWNAKVGQIDGFKTKTKDK